MKIVKTIYPHGILRMLGTKYAEGIIILELLYLYVTRGFSLLGGLYLSRYKPESRSAGSGCMIALIIEHIDVLFKGP